MADYVVVDKEQLEADLTIVADSIRSKGGTTEKLSFPQGMKNAVESIQTGSGDGIDTNSNNPATASDIAEGKEAFVNGLKVTGTHKCSSGATSGSIVKSKETTNFTIISGYSNLSVKYSSSVVDNNGELALGGTTNSVSVSTASDLDVIKGKYIEKSSSGATAIYYIPEDTTITQTGSIYSKSYVSSKANQMFVLG